MAFLEDWLNILLYKNRKAVDQFFQVTKSGQTNWGTLCLADLRVVGFAADLLETALHCVSTGNIGTQDVVVDGICIWTVGITEAPQ